MLSVFEPGEGRHIKAEGHECAAQIMINHLVVYKGSVGFGISMPIG